MYRNWVLNIGSIIFGLPFVIIGIDHFIDPSWYEPIVPKILGYPTFWVYASGVFEIALGAGLMFPRTRQISAYGIALMLVALYWANFNMWINDIAIGGSKFGTNWHIMRAIIQAVLIIICLTIAKYSPKSSNSSD